MKPLSRNQRAALALLDYIEGCGAYPNKHVVKALRILVGEEEADEAIAQVKATDAAKEQG